MKKFLSLLLALVMVFGLAACGNTPTNESNNPGTTNPGTTNSPSGTDAPEEPYTGPDWTAIDAMDHETASETLYEWNLGEFYECYQTALEELDPSTRLALMAIAEAKLYESGTFLPVQSNGGSYGMSRIVPRTITSLSWGNDSSRYYTLIIANELIKAEDRVALTALWTESETAEEYNAAVLNFFKEHGYTQNDTYSFAYSDSIRSWDTIATSYASDSEFIAPTVSALLEYDAKNHQNPALAESYEISDDGLTYTFHIRKGVKWVDQQGREIADVTADDWVASMQHLADNVDASGYLMTASEGCGIKNFEEYLYGEITDFNEVGVKALDEYTLQYTLEKPFPSFLTMVGYGVFAPLNRAYYKSQGGTFGAEGDDYTSGNYGIDPSHILYCGAFLITNYTDGVTIRYEANPTYWNADAMNIHYIVNTYNDGSDTTRNYKECKDGTVVSTALTAANLVSAKEEIPEGETKTYFDLYAYVSSNTGTTYCGWYNLNRSTWANWSDETKGISPMADNEEAHARTRSALNNQHFRLALTFGFDRGSYNGVVYGEDLKYARLRNTYTPGDFMALNSDVTVSINGTSTTFKAGTWYGEMIQAQLNADGCPIKVWDPNGNDGIGSSDAFDGWYNASNAKAELEKAIAELAEIGVEVSAANPIYIDYPYGAYNQNSSNQANAYKQSIENSLGGAVIVNLVGFDDGYALQDSYYRMRDGQDANYDISTGSGWGPDYGDPQTYLDTIQFEGYMAKNVGLW